MILMTNTNNQSDTQQQDADGVLKDSGVEIIENETQTAQPTPSIQNDVVTERLEKEFEAEFGPKKEAVKASPFADSLRQLKEAMANLREQKKKLESETEHDMEMLKKTKTMIEQKIDRLKELEKSEEKIEGDMKRTEQLESEEKEIEEDIKNINKNVSNTN